MRSWIYKKIGDLRSGRGAINFYSKAIKQNPNDLEAYYKRGFARFKVGHYKRCIQDFNKVIESDRENKDAYYHRGLARIEIEDYEEALADLNKADIEDDERAVAFLNKVIKLDKDNKYAHFLRGCAKYKTEEYIESIHDFTKAIELDPKYVEAYYQRARAKYQIEKYEEANDDIREVKSLDSSYIKKDLDTIIFDWNLHKKLASERKTSEFQNKPREDKKQVDLNTDDPFQRLNEMIRRNPRNAEAYYGIGLIRYGEKNYRLAKIAFDEAIKRNPEYKEAYYERGLTYIKLDYKDAACKDFSKAHELGYPIASPALSEHCQ